MGGEESVLSGLDEAKWSQKTVNAVIAEKAEKRAAKGLTLNCYSLDVAARQDLDEQFNEDNISTFVDSVYARARDLKEDETIRFQVAVKVNPAHWTSIDIEVSNNIVKMLNIDAFGDETGNRAAESIFRGLATKYPNYSEHSDNFKFTWLKHASLDDTRVQGIQYDDNSCSRFTLDHLFHLSNIDTFSLLEAHDAQLTKYKFAPQLRSFDSSNMPKEFAFLYRDTQSKTSFESLPENLKKQVINKKGQTLEMSELAHTEEIVDKGNTRQRNQAIQHKKEGFAADVRNLSSKAGHESLIENRDILQAFSNDSFLSTRVFDKQAVSRKLISEVKSLKKAQPIKSFSDAYHHLSDTVALYRAETKLSQGHEDEALKTLEKLNTTQIFKGQLKQLKENFAKQEDKRQDKEDGNTPVLK